MRSFHHGEQQQQDPVQEIRRPVTGHLGGRRLRRGGANADASKKSRVEVIELQLKDLEYESVDLGKAGPSLGDMSVYCATAVENGRDVGRGPGRPRSCTSAVGKSRRRP